MKNKRYALLCTLSLVLGTSSFAQDIHFSQYNFSPMVLNPALTSAYKDLQATVNYREQWHALNAYTTSEATFEMKLNQKNWVKLDKMTDTYKKKLVKGLALGLNIFQDKAGDAAMKKLVGNFSVAYHALLSEKSTLSAGLMGGISQWSIDPGKLRWNSQYPGGVYDPTTSSGENFSAASMIYGDYAAGLLYSYGEGNSYISSNDQKFFNVGASVAHLTRPPQSFIGYAPDQLKMRWTGHASALIGIKNSHYSFAPSVLYMQQGPQRELTLGAMIKYKPKEESKYTGIVKGSAFSVGCYYRNKDAVIPFVLIEMDKYALGVSYDVNVSSLANATTGRGGFEICLRFSNPSPFLYQNSKSRI